jgi:hypothetical protein
MFERKDALTTINSVEEFQKGQRKLSASDLNIMLSTIKHLAQGGTSGIDIEHPATGSKVQMRNKTDEKIPECSVIYLKDPVFDRDRVQYENTVLLEGYKITEEFKYTDNVAVTLTTSLPNKITEVVVSGACCCNVDIIDLEHNYAILKPDSYNLESSYFGNIRILDKGEELGVQKCLVSLATSNPYPQVFKSVGDISGGEINIVPVDINGESTSAELTFPVLPEL